MAWMTLSEAAEYLGYTNKRLASRCRRRLIRHVRIGGRGRPGKSGSGEYRFKREWLDGYLASITIKERL